jgi:hypothetical protein
MMHNQEPHAVSRIAVQFNGPISGSAPSLSLAEAYNPEPDGQNRSDGGNYQPGNRSTGPRRTR